MPDLPYFLNVRLRAEDSRLRVDGLILDLAEFGRSLLPVKLVEQRLGIPGFEVRRTAGHIDENDGFGFRLVWVRGRFGRQRIVTRGAGLILGEHGGKGQRSDAAKAIGQKLAAILGKTNMFGHVSSRT